MKSIFLSLLAAAIVAVPISTATAQSSTVKLPTLANTSDLTVTDNSNNVLMKLFGDGGFFLLGNVSTGAIPFTGIGARVMWYPTKVAFRAGYVGGTQWDDANVGLYSTAFGSNTIAGGINSVAMGNLTVATGNGSTAMGWQTTASEMFSTAMGLQTTASGTCSTAMGEGSSASGVESTAMGYYTIASGDRSTAMGSNTKAGGANSTAMGYFTEATGYYSTAMGAWVSTDGWAGACIIGDNSATNITKSSASNQMTMRFAGGYRFFTNSGFNVGVSLPASANSWTTISDSTKKTNFVMADGEQFLHSLSNLRLGSWNYKAQDPSTFRHYGPMAQEIFHYFGKDKYGTIGNDTTLASADMDGIMMICLQALEKRTSELKNAEQEIAELRQSAIERDKAQQQVNDQLRAQLEQLRQSIKEVAQRLTVTSPSPRATNISEISK